MAPEATPRKLGSFLSPPALPATVGSESQPRDSSPPGPNLKPIKWPLKAELDQSTRLVPWQKVLHAVLTRE